ncbi:peptide ABC transporter ATP-binding protein [Terasakiispira papahanaumokuakeensis]|uniref:Peptide ABC transporter ATP-binding protein n=1 Tax=Terasakiispira papahanaumokuakeensis TaxID=197479 RepID=A0A1E2VA76_9GAMM|nr:ABC transporter ATP-binding protein [Terasakiispira papahanaumokuakeensis]ODC03891.1 peptide ABC transporter ATP-binding protein [Terasakiispira papahanaumokuakeensis]
MTMIDIQSLDLSFGHGAQQAHILKSIQLAIDEGESFGLVGESGSGKTTILRCLAGQYNHWTGHISVNNQRLSHRLDRARCRLMQMVFQDPYGSLHPRHTIESILAEPLKIHGIDQRHERIGQLLSKVGLDDSFRYRFPHQLSGGQRQRVAIARALILEPRILLLDEPTSALDVSVQAEILNLLSELRQREGLTYLMVTHDLGVVAHLCDRIAVMQHGEILEVLGTDELLAGQAQHPYTQMLITHSRHKSEVPGQVTRV